MLIRFTKLFCVVFCAAAFVAVTGCDSDKPGVKPATKGTEGEVQETVAPDAGSDSKDAASEAAKPEQSSDNKESASTPVKLPPKDDPVDNAEGTKVPVGSFDVTVAEGGALTFKAPAFWKKKDVKARMFGPEFEIAVPKSEGEAADAADGRLTIMGAGGSVDANIERWYGQYSQPDGGNTKDVSKVSETTVADCKVTWVDIPGTLLDKKGGPFSGGETIERENYRMLAAIIQVEEVGQYFVKLYGPKKTISENEDAFKAFVESLTVNVEAKSL